MNGLKEFIGGIRINHKLSVEGLLLSEVDNDKNKKKIFMLDLDGGKRHEQLNEVETLSSRYGVMVDW